MKAIQNFKHILKKITLQCCVFHNFSSGNSLVTCIDNYIMSFALHVKMQDIEFTET